MPMLPVLSGDFQYITKLGELFHEVLVAGFCAHYRSSDLSS